MLFVIAVITITEFMNKLFDIVIIIWWLKTSGKRIHLSPSQIVYIHEVLYIHATGAHGVHIKLIRS